jgi:hypothetical protein
MAIFSLLNLAGNETTCMIFLVILKTLVRLINKKLELLSFGYLDELKVIE